jgi:type III secretion system YscI/HrpB-like protein
MQQVVQQAGQGLKNHEGAMDKTAGAGDVERFQQAMDTGDSPGQAGQPKAIGRSDALGRPEVLGRPEALSKIDSPGQETGTGPGSVDADSPPSLGDSILDGLERLRDTHDAQTGKINSLISSNGSEVMGTGDAMRLQMELMQLNMQQDLTAKVADKTGQGVQTLFKNQ